MQSAGLSTDLRFLQPNYLAGNLAGNIHFCSLQPTVDKFPSKLYSHFTFFLYYKIMTNPLHKDGRDTQQELPCAMASMQTILYSVCMVQNSYIIRKEDNL